MNKGEIRTRVLEQVDWQPDQSTSFKDKIDQMINRAYNQLALEAPFLFFEDMVLDQPWDHGDVGSSNAVLKYRIYTPEYELPADTVELRAARVYGDTHYDLEVRNQYDMERYDYVDYQGQQSGRPTSLFRGKHPQMGEFPVARLSAGVCHREPFSCPNSPCY